MHFVWYKDYARIFHVLSLKTLKYLNRREDLVEHTYVRTYFIYIYINVILSAHTYGA